MSDIIFTADDYGCNHYIDEGIIQAAKNGWINSVAMFGNHKDYLNNSKTLENAQMLQDDYGVDIGCHLTITSGKPLTAAMKKESAFVNNDSHFRDFKFMKRDGTFSAAKRAEIKKILKEELHTQIDQLATRLKVVHLSHHHNSLIFFPEYMEALMEVAMERENETKIRSAYIAPEWKHRMMPGLLSVPSAFSMDRVDFTQRFNFMNCIGKWMDETYEGPKPPMPDCIDVRHYGSPSGSMPFRFTENVVGKKADKKSAELEEAILDYLNQEDKARIEVVFHLISNEFGPNGKDPRRKRSWKAFKRAYPGVTDKYFDSRCIEFKSLHKFFGDDGLALLKTNELVRPDGLARKHESFRLKKNPWKNI